MRIFLLISILGYWCIAPVHGQKTPAVRTLTGEVNQAIPRWLTLGGEERMRVESFHGSGVSRCGGHVCGEPVAFELGGKSDGVDAISI
ncbi:MAG: hypothetical protein JNK48_28940 [Bryobacterales bacterium]|nr:hypothetical protein [Bryobacterales bacterium]